MSNERRKQQKLDKKKKARQQSLARTSQHRPLAPRSPRELIAQAAGRPFGPAYVSHGHDDPKQPALVSVVVTRSLPGGLWLPGVALVDRTCLGVKSAFAMRIVSDAELRLFLDQTAQAFEGPMQACEPLYAQSIVYHALDYARSLGFSPDPDFPEPLFGPRPTTLLETPWAHPAQPFYASGPRDNAQQVIAQLTRAVGAGNFHYLVGL